MGSGADSPCQGEMSRSDRGDRVGDYEHEVLIWSRPRWRFGSFAAMGKGTRRPQAAKSPCKKWKATAARRVVAPYTQQTISHRPLIRPSGPPSPQGEGLRAATWGRPYGMTDHPGRAGEDTRPYGGKRTESVGSAKPGADVEPHHLKFSIKPGPLWARREMQSITQILRAGNTPPSQRDDPRKWGS